MDCEDVADPRTDDARAGHGVDLDDLACAWGDALIAGGEPASWGVVRRLLAKGCAGVLVPSFANCATPDDQNLVLWRWGPDLPHKVMVYDPIGKLPKDQASGRQQLHERAVVPSETGQSGRSQMYIFASGCEENTAAFASRDTTPSCRTSTSITA